MKESLVLWAQYSLATDKKLCELLAALPEGEYTRERAVWSENLRSLHLHIVQTYLFYQRMIRVNFGGKHFVSPFTDEGVEIPEGTLAEAAAAYQAYGELFLKFAQAFDDADLGLPKFQRTLRTGRVVRLSLSDILTQYMNHSTHHRGQLSQILDELGLEHDIGGLMAFVEEV